MHGKVANSVSLSFIAARVMLDHLPRISEFKKRPPAYQELSLPKIHHGSSDLVIEIGRAGGLSLKMDNGRRVDLQIPVLFTLAIAQSNLVWTCQTDAAMDPRAFGSNT